MVKTSEPEWKAQASASLSMKAAMIRNCITPKKQVYDVTDNLAGYFFSTGAWSTSQPDQDKQCPIKYMHPRVQFLPFESFTHRTVVSCANELATSVPLRVEGANMVGPLYRVMTDAPATHASVPRIFAMPSLRSMRTFSIL